jgi:tryptophan-rich sensory protein
MNVAIFPLPRYKSISRSTVALAGWLVLCFAASGTAFFVSTNGWYASLQKPSWNPPPWLFGPVWTLLYVMMAVAAWLVWREGGWRVQRRALNVFILQWALNVLWTPLFFWRHLVGLAFWEIVTLLSVLVVTIVLFQRVRQAAGLLLLPYLFWVSFAASLNFTIWRLNG